MPRAAHEGEGHSLFQKGMRALGHTMGLDCGEEEPSAPPAAEVESPASPTESEPKEGEGSTSEKKEPEADGPH